MPMKANNAAYFALVALVCNCDRSAERPRHEGVAA
jgi:hypothetical protein